MYKRVVTARGSLRKYIYGDNIKYFFFRKRAWAYLKMWQSAFITDLNLI